MFEFYEWVRVDARMFHTWCFCACWRGFVGGCCRSGGYGVDRVELLGVCWEVFVGLCG